MLRSCISQIEQDISTLQSRVSGMQGVWDDRVSARIENAHLQVMIGACSSFYSHAYNLVSTIEERESRLHRLADKY